MSINISLTTAFQNVNFVLNRVKNKIAGPKKHE